MSTTTPAPTQIQPYLFFQGDCEAALEFYNKALGAEVTMMMRFKDSPDQEACPGADGESIMHATFNVGGAVVMASDGMGGSPRQFEGFSLSLSAKDKEEAQRYFDGLADGGKIEMPLGETFFSPCFGVVEDRFGVSWMVIVPSPEMV